MVSPVAMGSAKHNASACSGDVVLLEAAVLYYMPLSAVGVLVGQAGYNSSVVESDFLLFGLLVTGYLG